MLIILRWVNDSISNLMVSGIEWMADMLSSAMGDIWMVHGLSMEWHVSGVLDVFVPVVHILMWLQVLEEVVATLVGHVCVVFIQWVVNVVVDWLLVWSEDGVNQLVLAVVFNTVMVGVILESVVQVIVAVVMLWKTVVVLLDFVGEVMGWCLV